MKRGFKTRAEESSLQFRSVLGLRPEDALPARKLAHHLAQTKQAKVQFLTPAEIPDIPVECARILSRDSGFSALVLPVDHTFVFVFNPRHSPARQESDLMHEMAHLICQHKPSLLLLSSPMRTHDKEQEDEAAYLGGCLQVPREGLVRHLRNDRGIPEIAGIYGASEHLVRYRIGISGAGIQAQRYLACRR